MQLINKALYKENSYIGFSSEKENWLGGKIDINSKDKIEKIKIRWFC